MDARDLYIDEYKDIAVDTTKGTGLFPSVQLAQAIVESENGNSLLAKKYNNHFGIKANKSWTGKKVNLKTREVVGGKDVMATGEYFRVYNSARDSYKDRVKFLQENPRYREAGVFEAKTPYEQLKRLQQAGYATDPKYAEIINSVLKRENLGILDKTISFARRNWLGVSATLLIAAGLITLAVMKKKSIIKNIDKVV